MTFGLNISPEDPPRHAFCHVDKIGPTLFAVDTPAWNAVEVAGRIPFGNNLLHKAHLAGMVVGDLFHDKLVGRINGMVLVELEDHA
jgi:hypothetical protein